MPHYSEEREVCVSDTECYPNYWSIGFKSLDGEHLKVIEKYEDSELDRKKIASIFRRWRVVGFNFKAYDIPMILYAMAGATNRELKALSDELIQFGTPYWQVMRRLELRVPDFMDTIDLIDVSPGAAAMPSLKLYAGRLHSKRLQELPYEHDTHLNEHQREVVRDYLGNDLDDTIDLYKDLIPQIELRTLMSQQYGVDLRSKSDAQIAEAVIKAEAEKALKRPVEKPEIKPHFFQFRVPSYMEFETEEMKEVLEFIRRVKFKVNHAGIVEAPDRIKGLDVKIGDTLYRMGIGGLHSKEKKVSHYSDDRFVLKDRDVTSYYPQSILNQGMFPPSIGPAFLEIFKSIFDRRIAAKKAKQKNIAETLKIVLNGSFGKLGSPYSILYAPNLMIQTTLTGQLAILMLIERLEIAGVTVISGNTDGIVSKVSRTMLDRFNKVIAQWERDTGYGTEETEYVSIHSQSVNNYVAFYKEDGKVKVKRKGDFGACGPGLPAAMGQKKNPMNEVCYEAVINYLLDGTPIEDTIEWCLDPRKFVTVKRVTGGAVKDGEYLGKALRWYYAEGVKGCFEYEKNGNSVPDSMGAKLMMQMPTRLPLDLDHEWYIREAYAILSDIGADFAEPDDGRRGIVLARIPDAKNIHSVDLKSKVALCGQRRKSIRDPWVEYKAMPDGHRYCSKCKKASDL